jgi:imidazoleglycerol-phosphate dehydratase
VDRETAEVSVMVTLALDGSGNANNITGLPFLDHMLDQLASHSLIDLTVHADGDSEIDSHHTTEDVALALGQAISQALGSRKGIYRFGDFSAPLDEALVRSVLDLSGRPHLTFDCDIPNERIGSFETEMIEHFFQSVCNTAGITLHVHKVPSLLLSFPCFH